MNRSLLLMACLIFLLLVMIYSCSREEEQGPLHYYEVGLKTTPQDWRDSSFIVVTRNKALAAQIDLQLQLPVAQRKIVNGRLLPGDGGYNRNSYHSFKWHFKEDDWHLADLSIEVMDGRPHSDVDLDIPYWLDTVKRFSPWGSYIKREIIAQ